MRLMPLAVLLLAAAPAAVSVPSQNRTDGFDGAFTIRASRDSTQLNLNFQYEDGRSNYGRNFNRADFTNVAPAGDRITFILRREPGTFSFEGKGTLERAAGWYSFAPNHEFARAVEKLGFRDIDAKALFVFAMDNLTIEKIRRLQKLVSDDLDSETLVRLINHGAGAEFIDSMSQMGFRNLSSDEYRRMRDHGVTPDYVESLKDVGYSNLSAAQLVRLRDHGVTATYVRRVKEMLKEAPTVEELVRLRNTGAFKR